MGLAELIDQIMIDTAEAGYPLTRTQAKELSKWFKFHQAEGKPLHSDPVADEATDRVLYQQALTKARTDPGMKKAPSASQDPPRSSMQKALVQSLSKE
ncbi:hypothetical protein [Kocuria sp. HSID16901]|uniref:hypothetical protein n=1 Tax=Kocuria sp. HSID16901 TaxID=2419505 RepID=UPI00065FF180|nr:hypothetical protein [Kocuria sp. HSID16901]RUQ22767.1 hypothetical protein D8M21_05000 [Kocuria sp. HSID16901]